MVKAVAARGFGASGRNWPARRISWVLLLITLGIAKCCAGCGDGDDVSPPATAAKVLGSTVKEERVADWERAFPSIGMNGGPSSSSAARSEALGFLIRWIWIKKEARRRGVELAVRELRVAVAGRMRQFPSHREFRRYLEEAGMSREQFRARIARDALFAKLMNKAYSVAAVSRGDIERFYRRHLSEFGSPPTRDLRIVVTKSRVAAARARDAIESGERWGNVVRRFTVDASRRVDGRVSIDTRNVLQRLRMAVFGADLGHIVGPVDISGSWWVFRVERHHPARRLSLAEATPRIRLSIRSAREQLALDRMTEFLTRRYRRHTVCHNGYTAPECRNGQRSVAISPPNS